ncbi:hypothetical protein FACS189485_05230 [Spirochaetia bacterium]|nr:hypothetical protein FACS189485_05230 [Spirochaetia bacterium]
MTDKKSVTMEADLGEKIKELYLRAGYGRVLKSVLDVEVFHHFLTDGKGDDFDYFSVDKTKIYELSLQLKVSEAKVKRLLEDDYFLHQNSDVKLDLPRFLLDILHDRAISKETLRAGRICFPVANPVVKKLLEVEIYKRGRVIDFSFNNELLFLEIHDFLALLNFTDDAKMAEIVRNILLKKQDDPQDKKVQELLEKADEKTVAEHLKSIVLGAASTFGGDFGLSIVNALVDCGKGIYKKAAAR